jgi:hypothetical protein
MAPVWLRFVVKFCLFIGVLASGTVVDLALTPNGSSASMRATTTASGYPNVDSAALAGYGSLAFVSLGALYVLAAGHLHLVVGQGTSAGSPVYSPNGRFLAYDFGGDEVGVALANGTGAHTVGKNEGQDNGILPQWLPGGDLLVGAHRYEMTANGKPVRVADAPADLMAFSPSGDRYVFVEDVTKPAPENSPAGTSNWPGTERIEVSTSLFGPRTIWHSTPIRLDRYGVHGDFASAVIVLPDKAGILIWTDPDHEDDADGSQLYELRSAGGPFRPLAVTIGHSVTFGPKGTFAIAAGGNRYAWANKLVEVCTAATAYCTSVPAPVGKLTVSPAWSPNAQALAYVVADPELQGAIGQPQISQWYATHRLEMLAAGSSKPREIAATNGAIDPVWSANSQSLLFIKNDALFLLRSRTSTPQEIAGPLFTQFLWGTNDAAGYPYYGEIDWSSEFSWSESQQPVNE